MQPLSNNIIFRFVDGVRNGVFLNSRASGLVTDRGKEYLQYGGLCRCVIIEAVGPDCVDVEVGKEYVVENLKWTKSFKFDETDHWMTREPHILGSVIR